MSLRRRGYLNEAHAGGIVTSIHLVSTKVDEHGIPLEWEARLYDVARKTYVHKKGVKPFVKSKTPEGALAKMIRNLKNAEFLYE